MRIAIFLPLLLAIASPAQQPTAPAAGPVFAAATIKPSDPSSEGKGTFIHGNRYATLNTTVSYLIQFAYGFHARQIVDAPPWFDQLKYDLAAIPEGDAIPPDAQWRLMVQRLLADRFALRFHHSTRELSVFRLTLARGGPKLTPTADPNAEPDLTFGRLAGTVRLPAKNASIPDFLHVLQRNMVDRPIVDQTNLTGRYNFLLTFTPDDYQGAQVGGGFPAPAENAPPGLFTAIEQQLGLKLEPARIQADVILIDHLEKPSPN